MNRARWCRMSDPASIITRVMEDHQIRYGWEDGRLRCVAGDWIGPSRDAHKAHVGQVAALEVLAPIRDVIAQWDSEDMLPAHVVIEALAPLVYSTEELNRE